MTASAALRKLIRIAHEIEQRLPQTHLVCMKRSDRGIATDRDPVLVFRRQRLDGLDDIVDQRRKAESIKMKLHPPRLDLGEVENVVDQCEQMPTRTQHAVKRLGVSYLIGACTGRSAGFSPFRIGST